ncbi:MAG: ATP-binding cassette domain-containing protein, partial [Treponema sp.]|nr:ATP-binding cassette domain-containing protein [Treponema sp.]
MSAVIELQNVYKIYQMEKVEVNAVADASFSINEGEFAAISGPSGSGKSTLLNMIGLIDLPTSGKIILNGNDVYNGMELSKTNHIPRKLDSMLTELRRKNLGFIFQTFNLIPVLNVFENV